ncbi:MAG TPA: cupin domain-containing protein [bacterium]|nr:cupin domain-containing protein [bacterium]
MDRRPVLVVGIFLLGAYLTPSVVVAQQNLPPGSLTIKVLAEKRLATLPAGRPKLYWRLENFPSLGQAQAAAGPTGLAVESAGKDWLFTLGNKGGASLGGTKIAEIGPLPSVTASEYLLRINEPSGPLGSTTIVHTHPGVEALYTVAGELCLRTLDGTERIPAGRGVAGPPGGLPTQVSSCGSSDLRGFVMFVVDAKKPFSTPSVFP